MAMKRTNCMNVGIRIQLTVMIPSVKKPGKGVIINRAEETVVRVDPTDVDIMMTVLRGSLANAQLTMPSDLMCAEDNEIVEVDLECPECKRERQKAKRPTVKKSGKG